MCTSTFGRAYTQIGKEVGPHRLVGEGLLEGRSWDKLDGALALPPLPRVTTENESCGARAFQNMISAALMLTTVGVGATLALATERYW
jgi:hypothetical protein